MTEKKDDTRLRSSRLVFYKEDVDRIDEMLIEFIELSASKCAMLVDKEGHMVTVDGDSASFPTDTISALVAGSFAATREMARLLGEEEFHLLFHQGKTDNIQLTLVGDRTLLVVIFDDKTTLGMVRLYANETATKLEALFAERLANPMPEGEETLSSEFGKEAQQSLDDLFGE